MSYILDALKKSESERRQGEIPDLGATVQMVHHRRRRGIPAVFWIALALSLNAAVMAYVFWPKGAGQAAVGASEEPVWPAATEQHSSTSAQPGADRSSAVIAETRSMKQPVINDDNSRGRAAPASTPPEMPAVVKPQQPVGAPEQPAAAKPQRGQVIVASEPLTVSAQPSLSGNSARPSAEGTPSGAPQSSRSQPLAVEMSVPQLSDMPMSFQRSMPDLVFNSHIYSADPSSRRVMINNNYLREGDHFSGLVVEEITEQGVILNRGGTMVRVSVVNDWNAPQ
ncbi:general secretion pathway protein GspB [Marinobacteraceae bacterium S3BR75-40.1]